MHYVGLAAKILVRQVVYELPLCKGSEEESHHLRSPFRQLDSPRGCAGGGRRWPADRDRVPGIPISRLYAAFPGLLAVLPVASGCPPSPGPKPLSCGRRYRTGEAAGLLRGHSGVGATSKALLSLHDFIIQLMVSYLVVPPGKEPSVPPGTSPAFPCLISSLWAIGTAGPLQFHRVHNVVGTEPSGIPRTINADRQSVCARLKSPSRNLPGVHLPIPAVSPARHAPGVDQFL